MSKGVTASRFYMWRSIFAMAHADGVVTPHEIDFLRHQMQDISFNDAQLQTLAGDLGTAQDIHVMFRQITQEQDRRDFFKYARVLSWSDGDYAAQEQHILETLEQDMAAGDRTLLNESRNAVKEITLEANQWDRQVKEKGFLGLLKRLAA